MATKTRKTKQKRLLEAELEKFDSFFSAEDLFKRVQKKDSKIGIATVYRFLNELRNEERLHPYVCDRRLVYSRLSDNHCHFICQKCGKIVHFDVEDIGFVKKKINGTVCHFQIDVSGTCRNCLESKTQEDVGRYK